MNNKPTTYNLPPTTYLSNGGFTLIELLIFSAIFSIVAVSLFGVLVSTIQVQMRQTAAAEVNQQSQFLLETIQRYVENSSVVELPSDTATTTLKLRMASSANDPTYIYLSGATVYYKATDSGVAQPLTSGKVNVSNLVFTKRANPPGHDSVNVVFAIAYNSPNVRQAFFQNLAISVARVSAATFDSNVVPLSNNTYSLGLSSQGWQSVNNIIYFSGSNVGIGTISPRRALEVAGDIYIDTTGNGLILRSPNGACWWVTITNTGSLSTSTSACP